MSEQETLLRVYIPTKWSGYFPAQAGIKIATRNIHNQITPTLRQKAKKN